MHVCGECGQGYEREGYCASDGHALVASGDPLLGTEVLRYRLARVLGEGGMGRVYLGVQPQIGSRVAIKILSEHCARDPGLVDRFFSEARAVNLVRHENIVSVIDLAKLWDGRPFIVMEFVEGMTLGKLIRGGQAPLGGIVQVFSDVLSALDAAHAIGIVHRDLKPDNIMVTGKGHAKVLDFGIAKLSGGINDLASARTRTGALLGTPSYMAPEQISGAEKVDARSDVYAAGVVLFEAVTGRVPFQAVQLFDLMRAHVEQAPPLPRSIRPDVPEAVEQVILTALAKDPAHRFQTAGAMAHALELASASLPPSQWRDLSTRSAPMTRVSSARSGAPSTALPITGGRDTRRDTPPAHSAVHLPTEAKPRAATRARVLPVLALGLLGVGMVVGATVWITSRRQPSQPSAPIAQPVVADAGSVDATAMVVVPPAAPDAGVPVIAIAPTPAPAAAPDVPRAGDRAGPRAPAPRPSPPRPSPAGAAPVPPTPSPVARNPPSGHAPAASPDPLALPPTSERAQREAIAKEYRMHPDHVAIPGEIPIKRRPRMSRGSYDPKHFDHKRFLPYALKLARAELADAVLVRVELTGVGPDGSIDISDASVNEGAQFAFQSTTGNSEGCMVHIDVYPRKVETYMASSVGCGRKPLGRPRCELAEVFAKAQVIGTAAKRATLTAHHNGWVFSATDLTWSLPDDC